MLRRNDGLREEDETFQEPTSKIARFDALDPVGLAFERIVAHANEPRVANPYRFQKHRWREGHGIVTQRRHAAANEIPSNSKSASPAEPQQQRGRCCFSIERNSLPLEGM